MPTAAGAIRSTGVSRASEREATRRYDEACDCIVDTTAGSRGSPTTHRLASWTGDRRASGAGLAGGVGPGQLHPGGHRPRGHRPVPAHPGVELRLRHRVGACCSSRSAWLSRSRCTRPGCAAAASPRPAGAAVRDADFAMLLVWRDMFNSDFGLINRLFGSTSTGSASRGGPGPRSSSPNSGRLPVHVPGLHRGAAGDPERGGARRRRSTARPRGSGSDGHAAAAARRAGARC